MVFGINLGLAVNKAVTKTSTAISNTKLTNEQQNVLNTAYGSSTVDFKNTGTITCSKVIVDANSNATATTIASLQQQSSSSFNNDTAQAIKEQILNQVKQKNKDGIFDANAAVQVTSVLNEFNASIVNSVKTSIDQMTVTHATAEANAVIVNEGNISGDDCQFQANTAALALSKNIIKSMENMLVDNKVSLKLDLKSMNSLDQMNESSPLMLVLIAIVIVGPLILGGGGGAAGGSIVSAVVFMIISIGLGVALFFINDKIVCDNKDESEPKVKDECKDKPDKDKREDACLKCEGDVKVKRKKSILWIICLSMCILCGFISIISFGIYFSESSNSSQGNLEEYQNNLGGGSKEFKKFKKFITSILK